eukprot:TRINITY_DN5430_c0_g1_i1.p1 TRINITY_DN5430_c0_g1~~TRINITY_DN5430_c0_g1_i1.p1  ORF type:complete len:4541 (-),score=925.87 TRINITY_DN5430_c0_g1_i1:248-12403(-)
MEKDGLFQTLNFTGRASRCYSDEGFTVSAEFIVENSHLICTSMDSLCAVRSSNNLIQKKGDLTIEKSVVEVDGVAVWQDESNLHLNSSAFRLLGESTMIGGGLVEDTTSFGNRSAFEVHSTSFLTVNAQAMTRVWNSPVSVEGEVRIVSGTVRWMDDTEVVGAMYATESEVQIMDSFNLQGSFEVVNAALSVSGNLTQETLSTFECSGHSSTVDHTLMSSSHVHGVLSIQNGCFISYNGELVMSDSSISISDVNSTMEIRQSASVSSDGPTYVKVSEGGLQRITNDVYLNVVHVVIENNNSKVEYAGFGSMHIHNMTMKESCVFMITSPTPFVVEKMLVSGLEGTPNIVFNASGKVVEMDAFTSTWNSSYGTLEVSILNAQGPKKNTFSETDVVSKTTTCSHACHLELLASNFIGTDLFLFVDEGYIDCTFGNQVSMINSSEYLVQAEGNVSMVCPLTIESDSTLSQHSGYLQFYRGLTINGEMNIKTENSLCETWESWNLNADSTIFVVDAKVVAAEGCHCSHEGIVDANHARMIFQKDSIVSGGGSLFARNETLLTSYGDVIEPYEMISIESYSHVMFANPSEPSYLSLNTSIVESSTLQFDGIEEYSLNVVSIRDCHEGIVDAASSKVHVVNMTLENSGLNLIGSTFLVDSLFVDAPHSSPLRLSGSYTITSSTWTSASIVCTSLTNISFSSAQFLSSTFLRMEDCKAYVNYSLSIDSESDVTLASSDFMTYPSSTVSIVAPVVISGDSDSLLSFLGKTDFSGNDTISIHAQLSTSGNLTQTCDLLLLDDVWEHSGNFLCQSHLLLQGRGTIHNFVNATSSSIVEFRSCSDTYTVVDGGIISLYGSTYIDSCKVVSQGNISQYSSPLIIKEKSDVEFGTNSATLLMESLSVSGMSNVNMRGETKMYMSLLLANSSQLTWASESRLFALPQDWILSSNSVMVVTETVSFLVPVSIDTVTIQTGSTLQYHSSLPVTINTLNTSSGMLHFVPEDLRISIGNAFVGGESEVSVMGEIDISLCQYDGGAVTGSGLYIFGKMNISSLASKTMSTATVNIQSLLIYQFAEMTMASDSTLNILSAATMYFVGSGNILATSSSPGSIKIYGQLHKLQSDGDVIVKVPLWLGHGIGVTLRGGTFTVDGEITSQRSWSAIGCALEFSEDGLFDTTQGTSSLIIDESSSLTFGGGFGTSFAIESDFHIESYGLVKFDTGDFVIRGNFYSHNSTLVESGTIDLGDFRTVELAEILLHGVTDLVGGQTRVVGTINCEGELYVGGTSTVASMEFVPGSVIVSVAEFTMVRKLGTLSFNSGSSEGQLSIPDLRIFGTLNFNAGEDVIVNYLLLSGGAIVADGLMEIASEFEWTDGTLLGSGTTNSKGTMDLISSGIKFIDSRTLVNKGTMIVHSECEIRFRRGAQLLNNGSLTLDAPAEIRSYTDTLSLISNVGSIYVNPGIGLSVFSDVFFENTGTFRMGDGEIEFSRSFRLKGGIVHLNSSKIVMSSSSQPMVVEFGTLHGPGTIEGSLQNTGYGEIYLESTLTVIGDYIQGSFATLFIDIPNLDLYGRLNATSANLAGTLSVDLPSAVADEAKDLGKELVLVDFADRFDTEFSRMEGCNGILKVTYGNASISIRVLENSTSEALYVAPYGSDASCCGAEDNPCMTLQFATEEASDVPVILLPGIYQGSRGSFDGNLNVRIVEAKPVEIRSRDGPESTIIDCEGLGRAFIFDSTSLTIGEKLWTSVRISGVTMRNCTPTSNADGGGAIFFKSATNVVLDNVIFDSCSASDGGAIYVQDSSPTLTNCIFRDNYATSRGGGAAVIGSFGGKFDGCLFERNESPNGGGMLVDTASPEISNCTYVGGKATTGAGLSLVHTTLNVVDGNFTSNVASGRGGGLYIADGSPVIRTSHFVENSISKQGYPLSMNYHGAGVYVLSSEASFVNDTFSRNVADFGAGAFVQESPGKPAFNQCIFDGNDGVDGAALYFSASVGMVYQSTLLKNFATLGGGICARESTLTAVESHFIENVAQDSGGGAYFGEDSVVTVQNCIWSQNVASKGGAMFDYFAKVSINLGSMFGNRASIRGGAVAMDTSTSTLTGVHVLNNSATERGGGMYVSTTSTMTAYDSLLELNHATMSGSAIHSASSNLFLYNTVVSNHSSNTGGSLYLVSSNMVGKFSIFKNSYAVQQGGSIYLVSSEIDITDSFITYSRSEESGGGIHGVSATLYLTNVTITLCSSDSGAGVFVDSSVFEIEQSRFEGNDGTDGAAMYFVLSDALVQTTTLVENHASGKGGAISCLSNQRFDIKSCVFDKNEAGDDGGTVYTDKCPLVLESSHIGNSKSLAGSLYFTRGTRFSATSSSFSNNQAQEGAAIYCDSCLRGTISFCNMTGNTAITKAGAMYAVTPSYPLTITSCVWEDNVCSTGNGGAIYASSARFAVVTSTFSGNKGKEGGAFYSSCAVEGCLSSFTNCGFYGNRAVSGGGGAIFWDEMEPPTLSTIHSGNSAQYGNNIASSPKSVYIDSVFAYPQRSGDVFSVPMIAAIHDYYGSLVVTDNSTVVSIEPTLITTTVTGTRSVSAQMGRNKFDGIGVVATPGHNIELNLLSSGLTSTVVTIQVQQCDIGETVESEICKLCSSGTYNIIQDLFCRSCPNQGATCPGGNIVTSEDGYWLYRYADRIVPYRCPQGYCKKDNKCGANRIESDTNENPLCGKCIEEHVNWRRQCLKCTTVQYDLILVAVGFGWIYVLLLLKLGQSSSGKFKIFMYFAQTIGLIIPPQMKVSFFDWLGVASLQVDDSAGGNCIAPLDFFQKSILNISIPFILLVLLVITYLISTLWLKTKRQLHRGSKFITLMIFYRSFAKAVRQMWQDDLEQERAMTPELRAQQERDNKRARQLRYFLYLHTFAFLLLFSYSTMTQTVLEFVNCRKVEDLLLVAVQPEVSCDSSTYKRWSAIYYALLVFVVILGPFMVLGVLLWAKKTKKLEKHDFALKLGVLFVSYRAAFFWWESSFMLRRILIIGLYVIYYDDPPTQSFSIAIACILIAASHILSRPFGSNVDNLAESVSVTALAILATMISSQWVTNAQDVAMVLLVGLIVLPIALWLLWVLYTAVTGLLRRIRGQGTNEDGSEQEKEEIDAKSGRKVGAPLETFPRPGHAAEATGRSNGLVGTLSPGGKEVRSQDEIRDIVYANPMYRSAAGGREFYLDVMRSHGVSGVKRREGGAMNPLFGIPIYIHDANESDSESESEGIPVQQRRLVDYSQSPDMMGFVNPVTHLPGLREIIEERQAAMRAMEQRQPGSTSVGHIRPPAAARMGGGVSQTPSHHGTASFDAYRATRPKLVRNPTFGRDLTLPPPQFPAKRTRRDQEIAKKKKATYESPLAHAFSPSSIESSRKYRRAPGEFSKPAGDDDDVPSSAAGIPRAVPSEDSLGRDVGKESSTVLHPDDIVMTEVAPERTVRAIDMERRTPFQSVTPDGEQNTQRFGAASFEGYRASRPKLVRNPTFGRDVFVAPLRPASSATSPTKGQHKEAPSAAPMTTAPMSSSAPSDMSTVGERDLRKQDDIRSLPREHGVAAGDEDLPLTFSKMRGREDIERLQDPEKIAHQKPLRDAIRPEFGRPALYVNPMAGGQDRASRIDSRVDEPAKGVPIAALATGVLQPRSRTTTLVDDSYSASSVISATPRSERASSQSHTLQEGGSMSRAKEGVTRHDAVVSRISSDRPLLYMNPVHREEFSSRMPPSHDDDRAVPAGDQSRTLPLSLTPATALAHDRRMGYESHHAAATKQPETVVQRTPKLHGGDGSSRPGGQDRPRFVMAKQGVATLRPTLFQNPAYGMDIEIESAYSATDFDDGASMVSQDLGGYEDTMADVGDARTLRSARTATTASSYVDSPSRRASLLLQTPQRGPIGRSLIEGPGPQRALYVNTAYGREIEIESAPSVSSSVLEPLPQPANAYHVPDLSTIEAQRSTLLRSIHESNPALYMNMAYGKDVDVESVASSAMFARHRREPDRSYPMYSASIPHDTPDTRPRFIPEISVAPRSVRPTYHHNPIQGLHLEDDVDDLASIGSISSMSDMED